MAVNHEHPSMSVFLKEGRANFKHHIHRIVDEKLDAERLLIDSLPEENELLSMKRCWQIVLMKILWPGIEEVGTRKCSAVDTPFPLTLPSSSTSAAEELGSIGPKAAIQGRRWRGRGEGGGRLERSSRRALLRRLQEGKGWVGAESWATSVWDLGLIWGLQIRSRGLESRGTLTVWSGAAS